MYNTSVVDAAFSSVGSDNHRSYNINVIELKFYRKSVFLLPQIVTVNFDKFAVEHY